MAFTPVVEGALALAEDVQQVIDALTGVAGAGQAILLTQFADAATPSLLVRNTATGGLGLQVQGSSSQSLLDVRDAYTVIDSGSNTLYVDQVNHRVGIGTSTPSVALQINGTIAATGIALASGQIVARDDAGVATAPGFSFTGDLDTGILHGASANILHIATGGTNAITVSASQQVGIGKSPSVALDVLGAIAASTTITASGLLTASAGLTVVGALTLPSTSISDAALSANVVLLTASQTLTNKTLTSPIIATISNSGTLTLPSGTDTLVGRATTDTLTNKTLTSPVIASIVNTGTLTLPTSNDTLVGRATTDTLTNKTLTTPVIASIVNTGTLTLPTSNDTLVGRATTDTLTNKTLTSPVIATITNSGALTLPVGIDTLVARTSTDTLTNKTLTSPVIASISNSGTLTLPAGPDTLVGRATTDTLTNKTLTSPVIATITNSGALTLPVGVDTLVARASTDTLTNKTLTLPVIASISNSGTLTLPSGADTLVGRATTDTLTNKTLTSPVIATITNSGALTLPSGVDTLVARASTDTLTNKTLTSPAMTTASITSGGLALGASGGGITFNSSNSSSLTMGTGQLVAGVGAVGTPGLSFLGNLTSGFYYTSGIHASIANTERLRLDTDGNVVAVCAAWDDVAGKGALYLSAMAGTPTHAPADSVTGTAPMVWNSSANALYVYSGAAWNNVAAGATASSMSNTSDVVINSDSDSSGAGDILLQTKGTTRIKIPVQSGAGGILELVQSATPSAAASSADRFYFKSDDYAYHIANSGSEVQHIDQKTWLPQNPIINGGFNVWQRGTSFTSITDSTYGPDRWFYGKSSAAVHDLTRSTDVPAVAALVPITNYSAYLDCTTIDGTISAGDFCAFSTRILGYDWAAFAQAQFTLGFWVKSTKTGTYCVSFRNGGAGGTDRSYVSEYTVNVTNTWEYKTVTVSASPSAGHWDYTTSVGLNVSWALSCGSTFQTTAGAWQTGAFFGTSNQVNATDNTANDFRLWGITMNPGPVVAPFFPRPIEVERNMCLAYTYVHNGELAGNGTAGSFVPGHAFSTSTTTVDIYVDLPVTMVGVPTLTKIGSYRFLDSALGGFTTSSEAIQAVNSTPDCLRITATVAAATANRPGGFQCAVDATARLVLSAEI